jgi:cell division inhibitor SepF
MGITTKIMEYFGLLEVYEESEEFKKEEQISRTNIKQSENYKSVSSPNEISPEIPTIRLIEARSFNVAIDISDRLRRNESTILNIRMLDKETSKRIIDFLSGVVYALSGDIQRIGQDTYICVPKVIHLKGNIPNSPNES